MGIQLRIVKAQARLVSVPQPIALRYLAKDDKGHTHICERTGAKPAQSAKTPESAQEPAPLRP
jgi:hypothetical protein